MRGKRIEGVKELILQYLGNSTVLIMDGSMERETGHTIIEKKYEEQTCDHVSEKKHELSLYSPADSDL